MKIHCDVCDKNIAEVLCCPDEAALCTQCDLRVHAANKLANKHQRVSLYPPTPETHPVCDICQEKSAFFFCQEDRALLCRDCDVSIHSMNTLSEKHRRYLVTGTRVSLETVGQEKSEGAVPQIPSKDKTISHAPPMKNMAHSHRTQIPSQMQSGSYYVPQQQAPSSQYHDDQFYGNGSMYDNRDGHFDAENDSTLGWGVDELLNIPELADGYSLADIGSSKAEADANLGDFDWTADLSLFDEQVYAESLHEVPSLPDPAKPLPSSTKNKVKQDTSAVVPEFEDAFVVPDLGLNSSSPASHKRRRNIP